VEHRRVGLPVVGGGKDESPTLAGIRMVGTSFEIDFPAISHLGQRLNDLGRHDRDPRPLLDQTLNLAQGNATAPHDQAAAILDLKSDGIQRPSELRPHPKEEAMSHALATVLHRGRKAASNVMSACLASSRGAR